MTRRYTEREPGRLLPRVVREDFVGEMAAVRAARKSIKVFYRVPRRPSPRRSTRSSLAAV